LTARIGGGKSNLSVLPMCHSYFDRFTLERWLSFRNSSNRIESARSPLRILGIPLIKFGKGGFRVLKRTPKWFRLKFCLTIGIFLLDPTARGGRAISYELCRLFPHNIDCWEVDRYFCLVGGGAFF
jgi:hypothetical protein